MKSISTLLCISCLFSCSYLVAKPTPSVGEGKKVAKTLTDTKRDEEILKILDSLDKQIEKLDREQSQTQVLEGEIKAFKEPIERLDEALLLEDNLDDLDLEQTLEQELNMLEPIPNSDFPNNSLHIGKAVPNSGVGVKGNEEFLINQLDHSSLMDIDKELEKLNKKINLKPLKKDKLDEID